MGGSASVGYEEENEFQLLRDETLLLVDELTEDQDLRVMFVNYVKSGEWFVHVEGPKCTSKLTHEERLARAMKVGSLSALFSLSSNIHPLVSYLCSLPLPPFPVPFPLPHPPDPPSLLPLSLLKRPPDTSTRIPRGHKPNPIRSTGHLRNRKEPAMAAAIPVSAL
ncbi:hypothetical protein B484DRAFT_212295 [Ochromonadaceae sp. CCMP2298]|nr:hypothetical protein B484DRAFT_212295 [Ochromonadaceae sp. CCMP2298]